MCIGLATAIPLITAAIGSGVSAYGARRSTQEAEESAQRIADARNRELDEVLRRNRQIAQQSRDVYQQRERKIAPPASKEAQDNATAERTAALTGAIAPSAPEDVPISGSAPKVVRTDLAKRLGEAVSSATEEAKRLGKLGGYGDYWFEQGLADEDTERRLSTFSNFQRGNLGILPHTSDFAAFRAYRPSTGIGEAFQAAGGVLGGLGGLLKTSETVHDPNSGWTTTTTPESLKGLKNFWMNSKTGPLW